MDEMLRYIFGSLTEFVELKRTEGAQKRDG